QRHEKGHRLLSEVRFAGYGGCGHGRTQVTRDLVNHDQGGAIADNLLEQPGPRRNFVAVALLGQSIASATAQLVSKFAPQSERLEIVVRVRDADGRVQVRAYNAGHINLSGRWQRPIAV